MKRLSRKLTLALAALFWIAALLYFILLNSRKILPDQRNEQPKVKEVSDSLHHNLKDEMASIGWLIAF